MCKIASEWEPAIKHRKLISSVLYDHLDGWDGDDEKEDEMVRRRFKRLYVFTVQQKLKQCNYTQ